MDYAIEILKKYPESIEAYYILKKSFLFNIIFSRYPKAYEKFEKWYKLLLNSPDNLNVLDDPNVYMTEKLMVTIFYYRILYGSDSINDDFFRKKHEKSLISALENMRKNCNNKSYRALATIMLFDQNRNYEKKFIKNFPHHSIVPLLKLESAVEFADNKKYKKAIKEIEKLINTYKDVVLPDGWKFEIECYYELIWIYKYLEDFKKIKKYYMLIKEKAPNYINVTQFNDYMKYVEHMIVKEKLNNK